MKELYMVFDTETCNTPKVNGQLDTTCGQVYDFGLQIVDNEGRVYKALSFVNEDVFFGLPEAMHEAYFADKIPQYLDDMRKGTRQIVNTWQLYKIVRELTQEYDIKAFIAHYFAVSDEKQTEIFLPLWHPDLGHHDDGE